MTRLIAASRVVHGERREARLSADLRNGGLPQKLKAVSMRDNRTGRLSRSSFNTSHLSWMKGSTRPSLQKGGTPSLFPTKQRTLSKLSRSRRSVFQHGFFLFTQDVTDMTVGWPVPLAFLHPSRIIKVITLKSDIAGTTKYQDDSKYVCRPARRGDPRPYDSRDEDL